MERAKRDYREFTDLELREILEKLYFSVELWQDAFDHARNLQDLEKVAVAKLNLEEFNTHIAEVEAAIKERDAWTATTGEEGAPTWPH